MWGVGLFKDVASMQRYNLPKPIAVSRWHVGYPQVTIAADPVLVMFWLPVGVDVEQPAFNQAHVVIAQYGISGKLLMIVSRYRAEGRVGVGRAVVVVRMRCSLSYEGIIGAGPEPSAIGICWAYDARFCQRFCPPRWDDIVLRC